MMVEQGNDEGVPDQLDQRDPENVLTQADEPVPPHV